MNELNIKDVNYFNMVEKWESIPPYCFRFSPDFQFKKNALLIINCDSDLLLHPCLRSLYKHTNQDDFSLIVFDNSNSTKFNIDLYINFGFKNIFYINNTKWYYNTEDDRGFRAVVDVSDKQSSKSSSVMHCKSVDFMLKILKIKGVENLLLADSDVLFKRNPFAIVNTDYACIGEYYDVKNRIEPYLMYFNLNKIDIDYYDETRMLGLTSDDYRIYDTGGAFTEDLFKNRLPYKNIKLNNYIEHFGGGSYLFIADDINGMKSINVTKEEQPQKAYELIYSWLNKHSNLYF